MLRNARTALVSFGAGLFVCGMLTVPYARGRHAGNPRQEAMVETPSASQRISRRDFPSIFQAWNPVEGVADEDPLVSAARHDLLFHGPEFFGLRWHGPYPGLAVRLEAQSIARALQMRRRLLELNPNMVLL